MLSMAAFMSQKIVGWLWESWRIAHDICLSEMLRLLCWWYFLGRTLNSKSQWEMWTGRLMRGGSGGTVDVERWENKQDEEEIQGRGDHQLQSSEVKHYTFAPLVHWLVWSWGSWLGGFSFVTQHPYQWACFHCWSLSETPAGSTSCKPRGEYLWRRNAVKWVTLQMCS